MTRVSGPAPVRPSDHHRDGCARLQGVDPAALTKQTAPPAGPPGTGALPKDVQSAVSKAAQTAAEAAVVAGA